MVNLRNVHLNGRGCTHGSIGIIVAPAQGAALLRVMGECLFCGHCGADLPEFLTKAFIRCDGQRVRITQDDFGDIHVCGRDLMSEQADILVGVGAASARDTQSGVRDPSARDAAVERRPRTSVLS